jgi:hypothetical protein
MPAMEEMRIVTVVHQRDALPGVVLHVEHQRLDFGPGGFHRDARATGAIEFGLHN